MNCPTNCGGAITLKGKYDDDVSGNEVAIFECSNGHEWQQPSRSQIIRMIGWGHYWRKRRDEIERQMVGEPLPPTQY